MKIVNDVLRLYYGVMCVVSHGVATKTVDEGCLSKFPLLDELKAGLSDPTVAEELWDLHNRVRIDGRNVKISYLELCMMYRYFFRLANRLMVAVAMGVQFIASQRGSQYFGSTLATSKKNAAPLCCIQVLYLRHPFLL